MLLGWTRPVSYFWPSGQGRLVSHGLQWFKFRMQQLGKHTGHRCIMPKSQQDGDIEEKGLQHEHTPLGDAFCLSRFLSFYWQEEKKKKMQNNSLKAAVGVKRGRGQYSRVLPGKRQSCLRSGGLGSKQSIVEKAGG